MRKGRESISGYKSMEKCRVNMKDFYSFSIEDERRKGKKMCL